VIWVRPGSTKIPVTNRPGSAVADGSVSSRVYVTDPAAASAFFEMKTRPVLVATHSVPVSLGARARAARSQLTPAVHALARACFFILRLSIRVRDLSRQSRESVI
jgi:hypothetical protein